MSERFSSMKNRKLQMADDKHIFLKATDEGCLLRDRQVIRHGFFSI